MIVRARTEIDEGLIRGLLAGASYDLQAPSSCYFFNSGSSSLRFFLQLIGKGKRVGVQVYTCSTVCDAIIKEGCIPVFLDIDTSYYTTTIDCVKNKIDQIDVLLLTHLFGVPNPDYLQIKQLCREHHMILIDDLCQTYHAKVRDCYLEDLSDNYIYSFFYDKPISSISGGMLKVSDDYKVIAEEKCAQLSREDDEQGKKKLKVLLLMHLLLAPELYDREFRYGTLWKKLLERWPLTWNMKLLKYLVNGKWMSLINRVFGPQKEDGIWLLSNIEIYYLLAVMSSFRNRNQFLVDFFVRNGFVLPPYLQNSSITCSVAKRAIVDCCVESSGIQVGLFNWPELICDTNDYCKFPNAEIVIRTHTNIPCWMDISMRAYKKR